MAPGLRGLARPPAGAPAPALTALFESLLPDDGRERFAAAFLSGTRVLDSAVLAHGSHAFIAMRMRPIAERALACGADRIAVAHNHPSGDPRPSFEDYSSTRRLAEIAAALDIELIDHLILAPPRVFSMKTGDASWIWNQG